MTVRFLRADPPQDGGGDLEIPPAQGEPLLPDRAHRDGRLLGGVERLGSAGHAPIPPPREGPLWPSLGLLVEAAIGLGSGKDVHDPHFALKHEVEDAIVPHPEAVEGRVLVVEDQPDIRARARLAGVLPQHGELLSDPPGDIGRQAVELVRDLVSAWR